MRNLRALLLLLITMPLFAQTPNFSGIWKMDPTQSDFGPQTPPASAEYVIRHIGSRISFNYTQDGVTTRVDIMPDNEERVTSSTEETNMWTRANFSNGVLVLESRERRKFGTQPATGTGWSSRWALSEDGKQLIIDRTLRSANAEAHQKVVFVRQPINPGGRQ